VGAGGGPPPPPPAPPPPLLPALPTLPPLPVVEAMLPLVLLRLRAHDRERGRGMWRAMERARFHCTCSHRKPSVRSMPMFINTSAMVTVHSMGDMAAGGGRSAGAASSINSGSALGTKAG